MENRLAFKGLRMKTGQLEPTPGPWEAVRSLTCGHLRAAHNYQVEPKEEWTDADLRLISAAPDLLVALRAIAVHQENVGGSNARFSTAWKIAVEAIAKAGFEVVCNTLSSPSRRSDVEAAGSGLPAAFKTRESEHGIRLRCVD